MKMVILVGTLFILILPTASAEKRVDNPVDAWMIAQTDAAGRAVEGAWKRRPQILDTTDAKTGDFSIVFTVADPAKQSAFGLCAGQFTEHWAVSKDHLLHLWVKAQAEPAPQTWTLALYDSAGKRAETALTDMAADGKWRELALPLNTLQAEEGFNFASVRSVQVEAALSKDARLWLDDVYFRKGEDTLGVSDKTITQYMTEAEATRQKRVETALPTGHWAPGQGAVAALYAGRDLEKTNEQLIQWFQKEKDKETISWSLHDTTVLNMLYFGFSSKGRLKPGRLTPSCEKELLEWYWEHCELKNDIATTRHSTWWVTGSENHDINFKVANLLSSQIFMHEPDYAQRVYPDLGRMQGYGYGGNYVPNSNLKGAPMLGRGDYKDGKEYTATDRYQAWVGFWKRWFAERAKHGFFIEHNATNYMKYTNKFLHDVYAWCEDEELRSQARMFIDLVWAQWAQDQLLTCSGGAGTRQRHYGYAAMSELVVFLLGGPGSPSHAYFQLFSDYEWPRAIWELMLDRRGKGEYAYVSRKPNEEQDRWPRPAGAEYSMILRPDSRLARYSWVTPDYVLGVRMDHPAAMYCHLSGSTQGLVFATTPDAYLRFGLSYYRAVQARNVAILQAKKNWLSRHPDWFVGWTAKPGPVSVEFGKGLDHVEEKGGWVFVEEGDGFAAVRMVSPAPREKGQPLPRDEEGFVRFNPAEDSYEWSKDRRKITSRADLTPLIVEASRREHHPTLEAFQEDVLDNPIVMRQIIGGYFLSYQGCGENAPVIEFNAANNAIPMVDGQHVNYECPTFDSPYLKGETGSGVVTITAPISGKKLVLDFNKIERREEP